MPKIKKDNSIPFANQVRAIVGTGVLPEIISLNQTILDGAADVARRMMQVNPMEIEDFARMDSFTSNPIVIDSKMILSVTRKTSDSTVFSGYDAAKTESVDDYRPAKRVPRSSKTRALDTTSLNFQSGFNPVYYIEPATVASSPTTRTSTVLNVLPAPSSDEDVEVMYLGYARKGSSDGLVWNELNTLTHSMLEYFPDEYLFMVVRYAAIKAVEKRISDLINLEEDIELARELKTLYVSLQGEYNSFFPQPAQPAEEE